MAAEDIKECSICREEFKNPRLLPCIHSFCLECLEQYCRDQLPGDDALCPECRNEFQIPKDGVAGLTARTPTIDDDIRQVMSRIECFRGAVDQAEAEHNKILDNIQAVELEVSDRRKYLLQKVKELVDRNESELLAELQSLKSAAEKEVKSHRDALKTAVTEMERFSRSSLELRSKGSQSDVTQARVAAKKLLQTHVIPAEYHAPSYTFTPVTIDELLEGDQHFIGHVNRQPNYTAARVIKKISTDDVRVRGVTSLDDELFVLLERSVDQVAVYSINDYQLLRHLSLPGLEPNLNNDMTSCVRRKCLYMSDYCNACVCRYNLTSSVAVSQWSVHGEPVGLSMTLTGNLLVTFQNPHKLIELNSDSGQCVREIALQSDIEFPWHGVQMTTSQFVVCHGWLSCLHRVCLVDDDGEVTHSYGGHRGSDVGQLDSPCHLAVDKDSQCIFVADCVNDRVVLLSPTLEFVRYVSEGLSRPYRLYFHQSARRLYVGQWCGDVVVIQM